MRLTMATVTFGGGSVEGKLDTQYCRRERSRYC